MSRRERGGAGRGLVDVEPGRAAEKSKGVSASRASTCRAIAQRLTSCPAASRNLGRPKECRVSFEFAGATTGASHLRVALERFQRRTAAAQRAVVRQRSGLLARSNRRRGRSTSIRRGRCDFAIWRAKGRVSSEAGERSVHAAKDVLVDVNVGQARDEELELAFRENLKEVLRNDLVKATQESLPAQKRRQPLRSHAGEKLRSRTDSP